MITDFEDYKIALEDKRAKLKAKLEKMSTPAPSGMGYSTHQADHGTEAFEQTADLAMRRNTERLLYQVERALSSLEDGSYGVCRTCGKSIDQARLHAIPYTSYCVSCAERREDT